MSEQPDLGINTVMLVGRLAAPAQSRELPSGDTLWTWRVVVARPASKRSSKASVDTIDCATYARSIGAKVGKWSAGDCVELTGSLRRRFFKTPTGTASRYEVEADSAVRVQPA